MPLLLAPNVNPESLYTYLHCVCSSIGGYILSECAGAHIFVMVKGRTIQVQTTTSFRFAMADSRKRYFVQGKSKQALNKKTCTF